MKKHTLLSLCLSFFSLAINARAGGTVDFGNTGLSVVGVTVDEPGNYYGGGAITIQLWAKAGNAIPGNLFGVTNTVKYNNLVADGFFLAATFQGVMEGDFTGLFEYGTANLSLLPLHSQEAVIGLVAWNSHDAFPTDRLGVVTFVNPVGDPDGTPFPGFPAILSGWDDIGDLVMSPIPEPSTFALAGLGAGALALFRRRRD